MDDRTIRSTFSFVFSPTPAPECNIGLVSRNRKNVHKLVANFIGLAGDARPMKLATKDANYLYSAVFIYC